MTFIWCYWQTCLVFTGRFSCSMRPINTIQLILYQYMHFHTALYFAISIFNLLASILLLPLANLPNPKPSGANSFVLHLYVNCSMWFVCAFFQNFAPYILDRLRLFCIKKPFEPVFNPHIALQAAYIFNPPNKRPVKPSTTKKPPVCADGFVFQLI